MGRLPNLEAKGDHQNMEKPSMKAAQLYRYAVVVGAVRKVVPVWMMAMLGPSVVRLDMKAPIHTTQVIYHLYARDQFTGSLASLVGVGNRIISPSAATFLTVPAVAPSVLILRTTLLRPVSPASSNE